MDLSSFSFFAGFISLIPQLVVFAACIYFLVKKRSNESILMFIGTLLGVLISIFHYLVLPMMTFSGELISNYTQIYMTTGALGFISGTLFAIGLFIAIAKWVKSVEK